MRVNFFDDRKMNLESIDAMNLITYSCLQNVTFTKLISWVWKMQDELLWAAAWLYTATHKPMYMEYITEEAVTAVVDEFNWDLKYAGIQVLLSQVC